MFAIKIQIQIVFRILMAAAILLSAPMNVFSAKANTISLSRTQTHPGTPVAEPLPHTAVADEAGSSEQSLTFKAAALVKWVWKFGDLFIPGKTLAITETSTATPSNTPSLTLESSPLPTETPPFSTITPITEGTATPGPSITPFLSETIEPSATPDATQPTSTSETPDSSEVPPLVAPELFIEFSSEPNNAHVGDQVEFRVKITNKGQTPISGLSYSNILPHGFNFIARNNKEIVFDEQTRQLTWTAPNQMLAAGETYLFDYAVILIPVGVDNAQITDTAFVRANGLVNPVSIQTSLFLSAPGSTLTPMGTKGGEAAGLDGHVKVKFPEKSLEDPKIVSIHDHRQDSTAKEKADPWLEFDLELNVPSENSAEVLLSSSVQTNKATLEQVSGIENAVTATSIPTDQASAEENDTVTPLVPEETNFQEPVELIISLDGLVDLATLGADQAPFLVTLDEISNTWVRVPLKTVDREANTVTAEIPHFSTWGVGLGPSFPDDGNILLFDSAYPSLFSGNAQYSVPIWTPPGRNGMQPALALSYSSGTANGILGNIQAPWAGLGWNIDSVEIARRITSGACNPCNNGSYGYENKFLLLFNGTGYELVPEGTTGRYHTKEESFLYIQLHNDRLGNNNPAAPNKTGEWWEVVEKDGTRWRLGWKDDSEQVAAMSGYPGSGWTSTSPGWGVLGYAGRASNLVAGRWRVDLVTDVFTNGMVYSYFEETRAVYNSTANYDQASYLDKIQYTTINSPTSSPDYSKAGYTVQFERESRDGFDVPVYPSAWDNFDNFRLKTIKVMYGTRVVRKYVLNHWIDSTKSGGQGWWTTLLTSITIRGDNDSTIAPTIVFEYQDVENRAPNGSTWNQWPYARLVKVQNGWGGEAIFDYTNDGRSYNSWYNWRVSSLKIDDGINESPMETVYEYTSPCYDDSSYGWCNSSNIGELIGYGQTVARTKDFDSNTDLAVAVHKFFTTQAKSGREYEVQNQSASGTVLSKTLTSYTVSTTGLPSGVSFIYANEVESYTGSTLVSQTQYTYDTTTTGNLLSQSEYDGSSLYRTTEYQYVHNTTPSKWILDKVYSKTLKDANSVIISRQEYGYDNHLPASGSQTWLTTGKLTLSRTVNGSQTVDTGYGYDPYGNQTETCIYKSYGSVNNPPDASSTNVIKYSTSYSDDPDTEEDSTLHTYPTSTSNPLHPATHTHYDYGLGLPISVTDPTKTSTTTYDGLGRVLSITYSQDYTKPNIKYTYQQPSGSPLHIPAPSWVKMEVHDESIAEEANDYRASWQFKDGLGRVIQTQSPYESDITNTNLLLSDTSYNAQGLPLYQGLPRTISLTGGIYSAPGWGSVPHTTTSYDAIQRVTSVIYQDGSMEAQSYSGLRTTLIDRNGHKKVQEKDAFGRLNKVEEYIGNSSATYFMSARTEYTFDERDLLRNVKDAVGNTTTMVYDGFGRKIQMIDPDLGDWRYRYDVFGNLIVQIDAKRQAINLYYDVLNRLIGKTYNNGPVDPAAYSTPADPGYGSYAVKYYYDQGTNGIGHRTGMQDANSSVSWTYNLLGQVTNETRTIDGVPYSISTTPDAFGRPLTQTIPSNQSTENLSYLYNAMGMLSRLSGTDTYISEINYNPSGQVTDQQLGNRLTQQFCYDANSLRLVNARTYPVGEEIEDCVNLAPPNSRLNFSYSYQMNGNVSQIVDRVRNETFNYSYDALDRLLNVNALNNQNNTSIYTENYSYDAIGDILSKNLPVSPGTTSLMAWWDMEETSGVRRDSHSVNSLVDHNTVDYAAGQGGNAASFVTANLEYLSIADQMALSTGDIDFTLVTSVFLNSTNNLMIIANKGLKNSNTRDYVLYLNPNGSDPRFVFSVGNGTVSGSVSSNGTLKAGQWYTIAAWHDSGNNTLNIQVNNGPVSTANYSSGAIDSTYQLSIGAHSDGTFGLDGRLDQVALYKRVLNPSERNWLYNNGMGRSYADLTSSNPGTTSLVSWWSMDETGGSRQDSRGSNSLADTNQKVTSAAGVQANAARFTPASQAFLSVSDQDSLSTGDIKFTLAASVYLNSTASTMVIANKGLKNSNTRDYLLYYNPTTSKFTFSVGNGSVSGTVASNETPTTGVWYLIVAWHDNDANTLNIQVNNGPVSSVSYSSGAVDSGYPLSVGGHVDGSTVWDGRIDELLFYKDRILTAGERSWLYNNGQGRTYADLSSPAPGAFTTFTYDNDHKHAVAGLSTGESYAYDANGNMTCRVEGGNTYKQSYNVENQLTTVSKMSGGCNGTPLEITTFFYDGDGNMVKKINPDESSTTYIGGIYEVNKNSIGGVTGTKTYYPAGGAMRVDGTLYFVLKDHLGSASVVTDKDGEPVTGAEARYFPFGAARLSTSSMLTDKLYTGQRDTGLGIYYYGARFYSPYINHFLSADTIIPGYTNPQDPNRYSYVNNNPLRYTDPTGHMRVEEPGSKKGCSDLKYCKGRDSNGKLKPKVKKGRGISSAGSSCIDPEMCGGTVYSHGLDDPLRILDEENYMFGGYGKLKSWDGIKQIDPKDWNSLLDYIGKDISSAKIKTGWYDTPFYNYGGLLKGTACINGKCYDRSELNYIGEGEALAARGKSKEATMEFVNNWKEIVYGHPASYGVNDMTGVGWDYYHAHYP